MRAVLFSLGLGVMLTTLPVYAGSSSDKKTDKQEKGINKPEIVLYKSDNCPYCDDVMDYLTSLGRSVVVKNIQENPSARRELMKIGGKTSVPCLIVDGNAIYNSDAIIQYIHLHKFYFDRAE